MKKTRRIAAILWLLLPLLAACHTHPASRKPAIAPAALSCWWGERGGFCAGGTNQYDDATKTFTFSHALIHPDYHYWSIAPEELLDDAYRSRLLPVRVSVVPVAGCRWRTRRAVAQLDNRERFTVLQISGSGHWDETEVLLIVDCIFEGRLMRVPEKSWWNLWAR